MAYVDMVLPEFDREMAVTRTLLSRVPETEAGWRPHEKSMTLGRLAMHVADLLVWGQQTFEKPEIDLRPADGSDPVPRAEFETTEKLLERFDTNLANARAAIVATDDEAMMAPWTLKAGDQVFFTMPRMMSYRYFVMNHLVHHRAQLTVYLRMNNIALPGIYGPTADESF